tara:strand:+ start:1509 stop:1760 length:252 start_codon:yes stop_codon:yes gene_type:complete
MKKIFIAITILLSSCAMKRDRIYYSKNVDKCIHNLNEMQKWLQEDYANGDIPRYVADNYMIVIINTKCSLALKYNKKVTDCTD